MNALYYDKESNILISESFVYQISFTQTNPHCPSFSYLYIVIAMKKSESIHPGISFKLPNPQFSQCKSSDQKSRDDVTTYSSPLPYSIHSFNSLQLFCHPVSSLTS